MEGPQAELADDTGEGVVVDVLPARFAALLTAEALLLSCVSIGGHCFLELFGGHGLLACGMLKRSVPCVCPWDTMFGRKFDVLEQGQVIFALVARGLVTLILVGVPCQSFHLRAVRR